MTRVPRYVVEIGVVHSVRVAPAGRRRCGLPPAAARPARDPLAEVAVVVRVEPLVGERPEGRRERREPDRARPGATGGPRAARPRRKPVGPRRDPEARVGPLDRADQPVPRREPGLGVLDGRRRGPRPATAGPSAGGRPPTTGPRPGTVIPSGPRSGIRDSPPAAQRLGIGRRRRPPGAVDRHLLARGLVPDQPERVAADPAAAGHHDAQDGVGRDRRVDGVPAGGEHREPGRGREVVRRDDRARGRPGRAGAVMPPRRATPGLPDDEVLVPPQLGERQERDRRASPARRRRCRRAPSVSAAIPPTIAPRIWPIPRNTEYRPMIAPRSSG